MSIAPVVPNLLDAQRAFTNKYTTGSLNPGTQTSVLSALNQLPLPRAATLQNTVTPLAQFDLNRVNRGLSPLTARQSALALRTLATQQPATQPRRQGLLGATLSDLRSLVGAIPKLPLLAYHELKALPTAPGLAADALSSSSNPLTAIGNLASVPGLRMIPGSFVANQLLGDREHGSMGPQGLLAHPLFTALDLLPGAEAAAGTTKVAKLAREGVEAENLARVAQAEALTPGAPGNATLLREPNALRTVLTKKIGEDGALVPGKLGKVTTPLADTLFSTRPGRAFQGAFLERDIPQIESRYTSQIRQYADGHMPIDTLPTRLGTKSVANEVELLGRARNITRLADEAGLDEARLEGLYNLADHPVLADGTYTTPETMPGLTDVERTILRETRDFHRARAALTEGDLTGTININGTPEVFDLTTARKLAKKQAATATITEDVAVRRALDDPSTLGTTPEEIRDSILRAHDDIRARVDQGSLTAKRGELLMRGYQAALDEAGWEWRGPNGEALDKLSSDAEWANSTLQKVERPSTEQLIASLRPYARRYPTIPRLIDHLQNGRWSAARRDLDAFMETRAGQTALDALPFDADGLKSELSRQISMDRARAKFSHATNRALEKVTKAQARAESRAVPARFSTAVESVADEKITGRVKELYAHDPDLDKMVDLAARRIYDPITELGGDEIRVLQREARQSWQAMRDAGLDPIFVSRVSPAERANLPYLRVSDHPLTPKAAKARTFDAAPFQRNLTVAVTKDALDLLQRRGTEAFLNEIPARYGRTRADLTNELLPRAQARFDANPRIDLQQHLTNLINERWAPWAETQVEFGRKSLSPALPVSGSDDILIPRVQAENITRLFRPPLPQLTAALDPIMHVFRTSVLPLAPRWHLYNATGGAVIAGVEDASAFRYLPDIMRDMYRGARESVEQGGTRMEGARAAIRKYEPEGAPPSGFGTLPQEARAWDRTINANSPLRDRLAAAHNTALGGTFRKLYDDARADRLSKITDKASRFIEGSYGANQLIDDMYRAMIGTSAERRSLARGASREVAEAESVAAIRRAFQSWDRMTPIERSVMRSVVPFYGWAAHILRYAFKYPMDHPLRVAVVGSLARAELTDAATGLPDYLRDMVLMGDPRANGTVRALDVGPFNPFRDLPSYFTVSGFLGQLNPILTGVLESVGVNVQQGGPNLYPELQYDPETGRLAANPSGNLASNILGNILPQTELLTALAGRNESFNATLQRDPEAAGRMLMSNLGIPVLFRNVNVGEQLIRSELARAEDQDTAKKKALATGNLAILKDFPGLAAYGEQIRALQESGQLDQYRPQQGQPGAPSGAGLAYAAQMAALG